MSISFAPHVLIGYSDLGCIGSRFLLALSPISSGDDEDQKIVLQKIDALSYDRVTKLSYQPPAFQPDNTDATNDEKTEHVPAAPVSVFHYGRRNERPVISVLVINASIPNKNASTISNDLVLRLAEAGVEKVEVFAGAHFTASHSSKIQYATLNGYTLDDLSVSNNNASDKNDKCNNNDNKGMSSSLVRLDAKERIKDVFLSSLSMFLRSALIPSLFLLIRCNRARADNKDDTAKVIERLGQFINQRHGNGDTQPIGKDGFPLVYAVDRVATTALALPRATSLTYDFCNMYV